MSYSTGSVAVTNGSPTVTGSGTTWKTGSLVNVNDLFTVTSGSNSGIYYIVQSVDSDTQITLSANYTGATLSALSYFISQSFTSRGYPRVQKGDIDWEAQLQDLADKINADMITALAGGSTTQNAPYQFTFSGECTNGQDIRRNWIAKYSGTMSKAYCWADTAPNGGNATIRVQVGTGGSATKYVQWTHTAGSQTSSNTADTFAISAGDEIEVYIVTANQIGNITVNVYTQ